MEWFTLALLSAVFFGVASVLSKKVLIKEHASEFATATMLLLAVFLIPFLGKVEFSSIPPRIWLMMIEKALIISVATILACKATRHMEISSVEPLRNLSIVFVALLAFVFLSEDISLQHGAGMVLVLIGAYTLETHTTPIKHATLNNKFIMYFIAAVVLVSLAVILDRVMLRTVSTWTILLIPNFLIAVMLLIYQVVAFKGFKDVIHAFNLGGLAIFFVVLMKIGAEITYLSAVAIPLAAVSLIIAVKRSGVLISTMLGGEMFHDHHLLHKTLACILMIFGVYLVIF
ncbi:MAG TPA: EamA family transporter [Candidatus Nanoarchaeia archaeon]|nr:EamA family transporter [Candidatus Nanoarchaeia archaeon]